MPGRETSTSRTFGSWRVEYEFTGSMLHNQWAGVIRKPNGTQKNVIFLKIEGAADIAEITSCICHERVVQAFEHISCDFGGQRCACICYDAYMYSLDRWLEVLGYGEVRNAKVKIRFLGNTLSDYWRAEIRDLLAALKYVHAKGVYHGKLNDSSCFVFVGPRIKIINFEGKLEDINQQEQIKKMKKDLSDMGSLFELLFTSLVPSGSTWKEKDAFLNCFSKSENLPYDTYLRKVIGHPFLMSPVQRMRYLSRLHHLAAVRYSNVKRVLRMQHFHRFLKWNRPSAYKSWPPYMREVYNYRRGRYSGYSGFSVLDLLRFQRNLYEHFRHVKGHSRPTVEQLDSDVRKYFSGFLELVHQFMR